MLTLMFYFCKLPHTPDQLKFRYKKINMKKLRNVQLSKEYEIHNLKTSDLQISCNEVNSRVSNAEKIKRIANAMNNATQQEYFDNSFFEKLPAVVSFTLY